jgi:anhydro-N-acetylmuramic acid kinase
VANLGGIANITDLPVKGSVRGFDTGPGNVLLDLWSVRHRNVPYDDAGAWAASGRVDPALLAVCLTEPFFAAAPPKSTGRDLFNAGWLDRQLAQANWRGRAQDVQATLTALTARTLADAIRAHAPSADEVLTCGGGVHNAALLAMIKRTAEDRRRDHRHSGCR